MKKEVESIMHPYIFDEGSWAGVGKRMAIITLGNKVLGLEETMKLRKIYKSECFSNISLAFGEKLTLHGYDGAVVRYGNYQYDFKFNHLQC